MIAATLALGNWQRHRAAEKALRQAQYVAMEAQAPVALTQQLAAAVDRPEALRYRRVYVRGEYLGAQQIFLDNQVRNGGAGYEVLTPFKIAGVSASVLVDRGWVAVGPSRAQLPSVPAGSGVQEIVGRVNLPVQHYIELGAQTRQGALWQNLDLARYARETGLNVLPVVLELESADNDGLLRAWPAPDFGREQHLSYMVQWYSLAGLTVVLYLILNWRTHDDGNRTR
jgi:surfeit locus 1 family protein